MFSIRAKQTYTQILNSRPSTSSWRWFSNNSILSSNQSPPPSTATATATDTTSASSIAASFLRKHHALGPQARSQLLDVNQLHLLSLTLNRTHVWPGDDLTKPSPMSPKVLPPGYHLAYFTPAFLESDLGADGTDISYNPASPFTRRMWAGGEITWPRYTSTSISTSASASTQQQEQDEGLHEQQQQDTDEARPHLLQTGKIITETTRVVNAEAKTVKRRGEEMIVVGVEKKFIDDESGIVAVIDRRNWVFRKSLLDSPRPSPSPNPSPSSSTSSTNKTEEEEKEKEEKIHRRHLRQTPISLFRFSALTFNAHKIHYSVPWCREVEGHRNIVVHGPLNLINILDLWRDVQYSKLPRQLHSRHSQNGERERERERERDRDGQLAMRIMPRSISYRATNPLYADEEYEIILREVDVDCEEERAEQKIEGGISEVVIIDRYGMQCMKATIVS